MKSVPLITVTTFILLSLLISACASKPATHRGVNNWLQRQQISAIEHWSVKGRIGVKTAEDGFTSNLNWQYHPEKQYFRIYSSLGQTYAELRQENNHTVLEFSDNKSYESQDAESMIRHVLGYPLPIEHLRYWIMGLPYPEGENNLTFDQLGFLKTIQYKQWHITYN